MAEYTIDKIEYDGNVYKLQDNVSGYVTSDSDKKLEVAQVSTNGTYYPIFGTGTTAATRQYDTSGFDYYEYNGTTSTAGSSRITLGNNVAQSTAGNKEGYIQLYSLGTYSATIKVGSLSANRTFTLPNKTGTIALTSDIPSYTDTNTWRKVQLNGTDKLGTAISTNPLNLKAGTNVSITESSGTFTFSSTDTNTTYALSGALSSHKFTSTLTAGGSGSGTSTSDFTLAAGTGITITDDTSARKMTIACSVTNTDTKVSTALAVDSQTYYPVLGTDTTSASTKNYDKGFIYSTENGTTSNIGEAGLALGNSTASGTAGNKKGMLTLFGSSAYGVILESGAPTATRTITLPDNSGTVILDSDIMDTDTIVTSANHNEGKLITREQFSDILKFSAGYTSYSNATITVGSTSTTATLSSQATVGTIQIIDVVAFDTTTGEKVLVDWTPPSWGVAATQTVNITISIASAYTHQIACLILYRHMYGM